MATDAWVIDLTAVAATGNVQQLYPVWVSAGVNPATALNAQLIRRPLQGALHSIQIKSNGANGGTIEIWDIDGISLGIDVSSATTITNAQLTAAITAGKAKLIWTESYASSVGTPPMNAAGIYRAFQHGLAARYSNDDAAPGPQGICTLNLVVSGGFEKVESRGQA